MNTPCLRTVAVTRERLDDLIPLIGEYQRFYGAEPNPARNRAFFGDLLEQPELAAQFAAIDETGRIVGFATLYFLPSSISARTYAVLNDLCTVPEFRARGVGRLLVERCQELAQERGLNSLEWLTQKENETAQRLYNSLPTQRSEWFIYTMSSAKEGNA